MGLTPHFMREQWGLFNQTMLFFLDQTLLAIPSHFTPPLPLTSSWTLSGPSLEQLLSLYTNSKAEPMFSL